MQKYFIIDFDSTFVRTETLEELAEIALKSVKREGEREKEEILEKISEITAAGMEGKMPFGESLQKRLALLSFDTSVVEKVGKILEKKISPSILRNKQFFKKYRDTIYIISGGFTSCILPAAKKMGVPSEHILANEFIYDKKGRVLDVDVKNPLSQSGGKAKAVAKLGLEGELFVIGDGFTDWEIKEYLINRHPGDANNSVIANEAEGPRMRVKQSIPKEKIAASRVARLAMTKTHTVHFIAFTENVYREAVVEKADYVVPNLDEFLFKYDLPQAVSYPKNRMSVLLLENIHPKAIAAFTKEGYAVEYFEKSLTKQELIDRIRDVSILGIRSRTQVDAEVLSHAKRLMAIGAFCIGTDQIDLKAATEKGIAVFNAPYSNTRSVVELVLGEIIMLARGVFQKSNKLHQGIWDKSAAGSFEVRGKTLGIIGYGNIGSQVSVLAESLGMHVLFYDSVEKLALGTAKQCSSLSEVLRKSDIVTVHADGRKENSSLIGEKEFHQMKKGVLFLNLARGSLVDIPSLVAAIKSGNVAGAALDVFPKEPTGKDEPFLSELRGLPQVILTPHIGGSTKEAQESIGTFVSQKIIEYTNTGSTYLSNSLPNIHLPEQKNAHRLLHVHNNASGALIQINTILAKNRMDVLGQYLKTNERVGYVITDVDKKYDEKVLSQLKKIEGTIKFRILY